MKTKNKWHRAQEREAESWLKTDMSSQHLILGWKERKDDFKEVLDALDSDSSVLDVASGPISVLHTFPRMKRMIALDSLNDQYKSKYDRLDYIEYVSKKAEHLEYPNNSFDAVLCINALDHTDDYLCVMKEMIRCVKKGGILYLEYENTSPLSVLLAKLGYQKPLNDFHPVLVENRHILKLLQKQGFDVIKMRNRPQFSFVKVRAIFSILFGKKSVSTYEQTISSTNYGIFRSFVHYGIIFLERILFFYWPKKYGYFTVVIARKRQ